MYRSLLLLGSCLCDGRVGILSLSSLSPLLILLLASLPGPPGPVHALDLCLPGSFQSLQSPVSPSSPRPTPAFPACWLSPLCFHHKLGDMLPDLDLSPFLSLSLKVLGLPSQPRRYRNWGKGLSCFPFFKRIHLLDNGVSEP